MLYVKYLLLLFLISCTTIDGVLKQQELGVVRVETSDEKVALLFLNGVLIDSVTDGSLTLNDIPGGEHSLMLFVPGYSLFEERIRMTAGDTTTVSATLEKTASGTITITSDSGAVVTVGGLTFGALSKEGVFILTGFPSGEHLVSISSGSKSKDSTISIVENVSLNLTMKLLLQQQILIEHISNVSCEYCPEHAETMYHVLDSLGWKNISKVSYNANWPAKDDPLYLFDPKPQMDRTMLYGGKVNYALPIFVVNGQVVSFDADGDKLKKSLISRIEEERKKTPLFDIKLSKDRVSVSSLSSDSFNGDLMIQLVQDNVEFDKAPGSNGEKEFLNVFRHTVFRKKLALKAAESATFEFAFDTEGLPSTGLRLTAFMQDVDETILQTTDLKL